ncbi:uncharacterized protein F5891DRAFT_1010375 [Suillus fuscotomentosus]|uniref:Uncharacterized protein n=1 Tax=Suillus fuscotomentosus TaxID=1912939 RepID=A0AAD4EF81_9AGAM|nr:uncharacterized protein F5891DRAFT_1010375 [Suillus fuscotomentosus]KAG1905030.1 hypothetical protein F5891DRAFT_1010375 [Suillus fuscotomentosus]
MRKLTTTKLYIKQRKLKVLLTFSWQVVTPCFAVWIAIKHFRELRQHLAGGIIRDCFMVLMELTWFTLRGIWKVRAGVLWVVVVL